MLKIAIMNSKGGCGKTTIATNLASLYSTRQYGTAIYDYDPQHSSSTWMRLRNNNGKNDITIVDAYQKNNSNVTRAWQLRTPSGIDRIIIDTPAGLSGHDLEKQIRDVDFILIPVLHSPLDIYATAEFIKNLLIDGKARSHNINIGIIANRIKRNTRAFHALQRFLDNLNISLITELRDTQHYYHATEKGAGIHELKSRSVYTDILAWNEIIDWIENTHLNQQQTNATTIMESF